MRGIRVSSDTKPVSTIGPSQAARKYVDRRELRDMMTRKDWPGLLFLSGHFGLIAVSGYLIYISPGGLLTVLAMFLHGVFIVHLFAPLHECSHSTAYKTQWLNDGVYWFCSLVLGLSPLHFKLQHVDHHTYTQDVDNDPQMILIGETLWGYLYYASAIPYFIDILSNLYRHSLNRFSERELKYVYDSARPRIVRQTRFMVLFYLAVLAASLYFESWIALTYWLIPRIIGEPVERIIRLAEHNGCDRTPDMLLNTRTILSFYPVRWLSWNMPLHTAHHAVPQVPFFSIPRLNACLQSRTKDVRDGYPQTVAFQVSRLVDQERNRRSAASQTKLDA